jgi:hypothetical protein
MTEDDLRQVSKVQRAAAGAQERMPVLMKVWPFRPKLRALSAVRYGHITEVYSFTCYCWLWYCVDKDFCRSNVEPQSALGAQDSPSQMRSSDHEARAHTLIDDAGTVTPPLATEAGAQGSVGYIEASTSPPVIDIDPINAVPSASVQDPIADPIQIEQPRENPETTGA